MGRLAVPTGQRVQRFRKKIGSVPYASGGTPGIPGGVPKSGYTTAFDLRSVIQVVTGATAPVVANYGAYGPMGLINVSVGTQLPFSLPGFHAKEWLKLYDPPWTDSRAASPIVVSSTNNWVNDLRIPLTIDPSVEIGAWYLGDQTINMDLQINGAPASSVFSTVNAASVQGSYDVYVERFNAPAPDQPGGWLNEISFYHEVKLYGTFTLKNGDTQVPLPIGGDYERIMFVFYTGSRNDATFAPLDGLYQNLSLVVNDELYLYERMDEATFKMEQLRNYQEQLTPGIAVLDLIASSGGSGPGGFRRRDVLPTDADLVHSLYAIINSTSANNQVDVVVERAMDSPYAAKWQASAARNKQVA